MLKTRFLLLTALLLPAAAVAGLGDEVQRLERHHERLSTHRARLEGQLNEHGRRISRLKAQRRSVARDLQLKSALRSSQALARRLTSLQQKLNTQRDKLLALYLQAIRGAPDAATRRSYRKRHRKLADRRSGKGRLVARVKTSPLDSAEDLEEKADLLKDSEEKLRRRIRTLGRRIARIERRAKLRRHGRAALDTPFVEQSTRRSGGQRRAVAKAPATGGTASPPPPSPAEDAAKEGDNFDGSQNADPSAAIGGAPPAPAPGSGERTEGESASPSVTRGLDPATLQALSGKLRGTTAEKLAALKRARKKLATLAGSISTQAKKLQQKARQLKGRQIKGRGRNKTR